MEWTCVCVAALVKGFTNLWRWFHLWRHSEQKINKSFNESVTNRAEHDFFFNHPADHSQVNMVCKTPYEIYLVSLIVCVGHFGCVQMRVSWPTDDWTVNNRTRRRNLRPGPFKTPLKGHFCPWMLENRVVYLMPTGRPGHSWKRDVLVSRRTPGQIIF